MAHCAVIFAIAQLSCSRFHCCDRHGINPFKRRGWLMFVCCICLSVGAVGRQQHHSGWSGVGVCVAWRAWRLAAGVVTAAAVDAGLMMIRRPAVCSALLGVSDCYTLHSTATQPADISHLLMARFHYANFRVTSATNP